LESIVYDGSLSKKDEIIIPTLEGVIRTKIRNMQEALPLNKGFKVVENVCAAAGIRLQVVSKESILPGMPFRVLKEEQELEKIFQELKKEISQETKTDEEGILIKADSLGSLEALIYLLRQKQIKFVRADIGDITKKDIFIANSLPEESRAILGFNSKISEEVSQEKLGEAKVICGDVIYKLIEDFEEWRQQKQTETERRKLSELPSIAKISVLDFVFRNTNPSIFGVRIEGGVLKQELEIINNEDKKIGRIKAIQSEKVSLGEAKKGQEVAISMPGVNFERDLNVGEMLYTNLSEFQFRKFKDYKNLLTSDEKSVLQEIAFIKRRKEATWGI